MRGTRTLPLRPHLLLEFQTTIRYLLMPSDTEGLASLRSSMLSWTAMNTMTVILIAFGLAMDAFAVSVTSGLTIKDLRINHALTLAASFGLFQAIMPVVGRAAGGGVGGNILDSCY